MTLDAVSTTHLPLSQIRTDGGTQPRATLDFAAVYDYMDAMEAGVKFPPVTVFYDGSDYWLADGFHRHKAAFGAGLEEIACDIHQGTQQDAQWYSFAANKSNGLRRTNEDKQRAVKAAIRHPLSSGLSANAIAKHVGVSHTCVDEWKRQMGPLAKSASAEAKTVKCSDGRTMNTANIGKAKRVAVAAAVPPVQDQSALACEDNEHETEEPPEAVTGRQAFMQEISKAIGAVRAALKIRPKERWDLNHIIEVLEEVRQRGGRKALEATR